jgi:NADH-quinone oxidoreductase subunit M
MTLTLLLLIPALFAVICGFVATKQAKLVALVGSGITLLVTLFAFAGFNGTINGPIFQLLEQRPWFPILNIGYSLGIDGPGLLMILLTAFLTVAAVWFSLDKVTEREKEYYALLLALEATVIGAFASLDLILFYVFFEACLVPAYFLIGIWGGRNRVRAGTKFFVYTVVGSLVMLVSIIALYIQTGTFNVIEIQQKLTANPLSMEAELLIFLGFAVAFAVKTGLFPFHTWLPDAYAEAPAPVTALLSGAMAKLGTFGFLRFGVMLLPDGAQSASTFLIILAVISILYGGLVAAVQRDVKRVLAYSSISHLGFVVAGVFSGTNPGLSGATLQMVNHGITSGMLFLMVGMLYARRGSTNIHALGGIWEQMPLFGRFFLIATLSSVGLPLTNGFVGEFQILLGTFQNYPVLAGIGTTGVIVSAIYMLGMFQRAMYGPVERAEVRRLSDLSPSETGLLSVFVVLVFLLGIQPGILQHKIDGSIDTLVTHRIAPAEAVKGSVTPVPIRRPLLQRPGSPSGPSLVPSLAPTPGETTSPSPAAAVPAGPPTPPPHKGLLPPPIQE